MLQELPVTLMMENYKKCLSGFQIGEMRLFSPDEYIFIIELEYILLQL